MDQPTRKVATELVVLGSSEAVSTSLAALVYKSVR